MIAWATIALLLLTGCTARFGHEKPFLRESSGGKHVMFGCEFRGVTLSLVQHVPAPCVYEDSREGK